LLTHIVLLQPKPETTVEQITTAFDHVKALQEAISGIIDIQAGRNMSNSNQGYTYGFVMRFVDNDRLKAYAPHPAHQVVSEELQRICQKIIDFDIE
jgi:stress responsive alpha/beta barrel protein